MITHAQVHGCVCLLAEQCSAGAGLRGDPCVLTLRLALVPTTAALRSADSRRSSAGGMADVLLCPERHSSSTGGEATAAADEAVCVPLLLLVLVRGGNEAPAELIS